MKQITKAQLEDIVEHISDNIGGYIYNSAAQNIAPTEATTTTSQEYKVGEQFYYNKILYTATVPIANGGTIVTSGANKNCEPSPTLTKQLADLGTASTKNSTSVVTSSSDLVESGAVYDALGFGNKNKLNKEDIYSKHSNLSVTQLATGINITANSGATWASVVYKLNIEPNTDYIVSSDVDLTDGIVFFQLKHGTTKVKTGTTITESGKLTLDFNLAYNDEVYLHIFVSNATAYLTNADLNNLQLEKGSTATAYEPYHASVEDSLAEKCDNSVIGTVEDGTNPTKSYAVGEHMIRGGKFCTCTVAVTTSSTWTLGSNYVEGDVASDLVYKAGDSVGLAANNHQVPYSGYITATSVWIRFFIPLNKKCIGISNVTFSNTTKVYVRSLNGYLVNDSLLSSFTISIDEITDNGIYLQFSKSDGTAFDVTNNTPVSVALAKATITFS